MALKKVARLGDGSSHGGTIVSGCSTTVNAEGIAVAKDGCLHSCPLPGHGTTPVTSTSKNNAEGSGIVRDGDVAGCGAVISATVTSVFSN